MRESSSTFTRAVSYSGAPSDTQVVLGGGNNNADFSHFGTYLLVDSILPFIQGEEGGFEGTNSGNYVTAPLATEPFDNTGFVVTVGEGIIGEKGIRLHIHTKHKQSVTKADYTLTHTKTLTMIPKLCWVEEYHYCWVACCYG